MPKKRIKKPLVERFPLVCEFCKKNVLVKKKENRFCSLMCSAKNNIKNCPKFGFKKGIKGIWSGRKRPDIAKMHTGTGNPVWRGEKASLTSLHCWIRDNFKKINICEICSTKTAKTYDWSNKDHKYSRNREDWWVLCRKCHMKYDKEKFGCRADARKNKKTINQKAH